MVPANRKPPAWALAIVLAMLAGTGWLFLGHLRAMAPALDALAPSTVTLSAPVEHYSPGQRSGLRGPYAIFRWEGGTRKATLEDLCFLVSRCATPPEVARLRAGDRVTLWMKSGKIWQVEKDGRRLLAYDAMRAAWTEAMHRRLLVEVPLWLSMAGLVAFVLLRRKPRDAPGGPRAMRRTVQVKFRISSRGPGASPD